MPYVDALRAELMLWEGNDNGAGAELLMDVQRRLRALPGPDAWTQALFRLEAFARTARAVGNWDLAEFTARQMLEHDAAYAGSHYALALVAQHRGNLPLAQRGNRGRAQVLARRGSRSQRTGEIAQAAERSARWRE